MGLRKSKIWRSSAIIRIARTPHGAQEMFIRGVDFINDIKATNVNSTWYALLERVCFKNKYYDIGRSLHKGNDYEMLRELVQEKVKSNYLLST